MRSMRQTDGCHGSHGGKCYSPLRKRGMEAQNGGYCAGAFVAMRPDPHTHWARNCPLCVDTNQDITLLLSEPQHLLIVPTSSPLLSRSTNMCLKQEGEEVKARSAPRWEGKGGLELQGQTTIQVGPE